MFAKKTFTSLKELGYFGAEGFSERAFEGVKVSGTIALPGHCKEVSKVCFLNATVNTINLQTILTCCLFFPVTHSFTSQAINPLSWSYVNGLAEISISATHLRSVLRWNSMLA